MNEKLIIASASYESYQSTASGGNSVLFILIYLVLFLGLLGIIYVKKSNGYKSKQLVKKLSKGKTSEQSAVIGYFLAQGCLANPISDEEFFKIVNDEKEIYGQKNRALQKLGIDEDQVNEIEPVYFEGFRSDGAYSKQTYNGSGPWVSSKYEVTWLFFSDQQVHVYRCEFHLDSDMKKEFTAEYFYKDVNSFSTISEDVEDQNGNMVPTEMFSMQGAGIDFSCALTNLEGAGKSIDGMRQKLREKKLQV